MGSAVLTNAVATKVSQTAPTTIYDSTTQLAVRNFTAKDVNSYIYWSRPFPLGATISSAKIVFYTYAIPESGSHGFIFTRLGIAFSASKTNYNNRPTTFISGDKTVSKTGAQANKTMWEVDITDHMQTVSNGGKWYGYRIIPSITEDITRHIYSENATDATLRPRLEVTWSDAPQTPTGLSPSGGRAVGEPKPVVRANFIDVSGATALQAVNVQINATDVWTSPTFDSGTVLTSVPELDLEATAFAGVADGSTVFWRVRFQDAAGIWSPWSASTSFKYDAKGTLAVNNPLYGSPALYDDFDGSAQGWVTSTNSSVAYSTTQKRSNPGSLAITATAAATASAKHDTSNTSGVPVVVGRSYKADAYFRANTTGRSVQLLINWYTSGGALVSTSTGSTVTDNNTGWTAATLTATAPATAAFAILIAQIVSPGAGEIHYLDDATVVDTTTLPVIEDATPPIVWTFTGETQAAYQIQIKHAVNGVDVIDWDTGKLTSTATSVTVPAGKINEPTNTTYTLTVRVWDNKAREATAGFPVYSEVVRLFTFVPGATIGTTGLTAVPNATGVPKVVLSWTAATFPDRFNILRNGKIIAASLDPNDTFVSGTTHTWTDNTPHPNRPLTYAVQRVVNDVASSSNSTAAVTVASKGIWLKEPVTGLELLINGREDRAFTLNEQGAVLQSIAPNSAPMAINQSLGGLEGTITGTLLPVNGLTAQQWRDRYVQLRNMRVKKFYLTVGDYTFQCVCQEFTYEQLPTPTPAFQVSFKFYQQDHLTNPLNG